MKKSPLTNLRWTLLVSRPQAIQSDALRKNHTWETLHLARSIRDVGAADHCESDAPGLRNCRLCGAWLLHSSQCGCYRVAQRQGYSDQDYSKGYKLD